MSTDSEILAQIRTLASAPTTGIPAGPGIAPGGAPTAGSLTWWRNPGAPVTEGVTCYDDIPEAKRYAAQGYTAGGTRALAPQDLEPMLVLCDKLGADTITSAQAEDLVKGAATVDTDSAIYALLSGWSQGGSFGKPSLYIGGQRIADLVAKAKGTATPSGKPV